MKKRLLALLMAAIMVLSLAPATAFADDGGDGIYFVPTTAYPMEHNVTVNGEPITMYCLQEAYAWPFDPQGPYYKSEGDHPFLTNDQLMVMRKLLWAGYPHDTQGLIREYALAMLEGEYDEEELEGWFLYCGTLATQRAVWELMARDGVAGNKPAQGENIIYDSVDFGDLANKLIDYALSGDHIPDVPNTAVVTISGDGKFTENDGVWSTGDLIITDPTGFELYFELVLPDGIKAYDGDGNEITHVLEGKAFHLVAESEDKIGSALTVKAAMAYPSDVSAYVTDVKVQVQGENAGDVVERNLQSMLSVGTLVHNMSGELTLTKETSPDPDPEHSTSPNPDPEPSTNPDPNPDPEPSTSPDTDPEPSTSPDTDPEPSTDPDPSPEPSTSPDPKTGALSISKTVKGDLGDKTKLFTFTVTFDADGTYSYTGSRSGTIKSGGTVQLMHGDSITITGLPEGTSYTVVESDNDGYIVDKTNDTGKISADKTTLAGFTNTKSSVPKAGDDRNFTQWVLVMLVSAAGLLTTLVVAGKKRKVGKHEAK